MALRGWLFLLWALVLAGCGNDQPGHGDGQTVVSLLGEGDASGYARAQPSPIFRFPRDNGPHPDYRSEWWYFTGNLSAADGRAYGFQLTFFRFALAPADRPGESAWGTRQVWMAHFALTDVDGGRFHRAEAFRRGALDLAGARAQPFRAWVGRWEAASTGEGLFPMRLRAHTDEFAIDLELQALRPGVLQGRDGYSQKGPDPGNASLYYAYTRLGANGSVDAGQGPVSVSGDAWLDREWSTSALGPDIVGWDWLSLQLDDGRDLMLYRLRRTDGTAGSFSAGSMVSPDGRVTRLGATDFSMVPGRRWKSPASGASYPVEWTIRVPSAGLAVEVQALLDDQEMDLSVRYWEGAVGVTGGAPGGRGYLELTGY